MVALKWDNKKVESFSFFFMLEHLSF